MNKVIRQKWIDALRSGEYKQGKGRLRNSENEFCCLGVLCDLAAKEGVVKEVAGFDEFYYDGGSLTPPPSVKEWAESDLECLDIDYTMGVEGHYTELNDDEHGLTFDQIADLIEVFA